MKRFFSGFLALVLILSLSAAAMAKVNDRLPGEGIDGTVHGQGHDWAEGTKGNSNYNKPELIAKFAEKDIPGYRNHTDAGGGPVVN